MKIVSKFVPKYAIINTTELEALNKFVQNAKKLFVLSGAGLSTESGIPDYRSEGVGLYSRTNHKPMQHMDFCSSSNKRKIYWARNYVSWPIFSSFKPNIAHKTLASWEKKGKVHYHATQNVDGLLVKSGLILSLFSAGCLRLTELHGSSYRVRCLDCDFRMSRDAMQILIKAQNPEWSAETDDTNINPDNDVRLSDDQIVNFKVPKCPKCSNDRLKPDIVFFGDNIPKSIVEHVNTKLSESDALLTVGTSLQVYSAFRIVLRARDLKIPIAILNIGNTRGDSYCDLKISTICSDVIRQIKF